MVKTRVGKREEYVQSIAKRNVAMQSKSEEECARGLGALYIDGLPS